jgi:hypothetical protein
MTCLLPLPLASAIFVRPSQSSAGRRTPSSQWLTWQLMWQLWAAWQLARMHSTRLVGMDAQVLQRR